MRRVVAPDTISLEEIRALAQARFGDMIKALSRQELADLTGTTVETAICIMSRWQKEDVVHTEKDGFLIVNRAALEEAAGG